MVDPGGFQVLRRFTLLSPLFLALTFLVSLGNTLRHVWRMLRKGGLLKQNPGIDSSIMIIALPMIACMMSYRSVTRMWMICANSKVGSLGYVEDFQGNRTWEKLTESVDALTKQGIYLFNGTCFLEAAYSLFTTSVEAYLGGDRTLKFNERVYRSRTRVHYFFLGMGAIASSAAIGNVVTVEMTFEKQLTRSSRESPPERGFPRGAFAQHGGHQQMQFPEVPRLLATGDAEKHDVQDHDEDEEVESPAKSGGKVLVGLTIFLGTVLMLVAIGSAAYMAYQRRRAGPAERPVRCVFAAEAPATEADATAPSFSGPEAGA
eukprot:g31684.t1